MVAVAALEAAERVRVLLPVPGETMAWVRRWL